MANNKNSKPNPTNRVNDLFSITAHELKTPITTLKLLTQVYIRRFEKGIAAIKIEELKTMDRELDRLTGLISDLLDASTMENGKLNLRPKVIDITKLVVDVVAQMSLLTKNYTITFNEGGLSTGTVNKVVADPNRLTQVLINLITNATKFSPVKSTIQVEAKRIKNKVVVSVADKGKGISKENQVHLFERYYQTSTQISKGVGLGLYISKEIIHASKGEIWVKSKLHQGSTFSFSLPCV